MTYTKGSTYLRLAYAFAKEVPHSDTSLDEICQIVSFMLSDGKSLTYVHLFAHNFDGTFSMVGSYSTDADLQKRRQNIPIDANLPAPRAMNTNEAIIIKSYEELDKKFPGAREAIGSPIHRNLIAVPISKKMFPTGAMVVQSDSLEFSTEHVDFLRLIGVIVADKLDDPKDSLHMGSVLYSPSVIPEGDNELTPRQCAVQEMMAKGLTNHEIAATLGYSESTVRRESVILFSKLGVHNRHDAGSLLRNLQQIKDNNMDNFFSSKMTSHD